MIAIAMRPAASGDYVSMMLDGRQRLIRISQKTGDRYQLEGDERWLPLDIDNALLHQVVKSGKVHWAYSATLKKEWSETEEGVLRPQETLKPKAGDAIMTAAIFKRASSPVIALVVDVDEDNYRLAELINGMFYNDQRESWHHFHGFSSVDVSGAFKFDGKPRRVFTPDLLSEHIACSNTRMAAMQRELNTLRRCLPPWGVER